MVLSACAGIGKGRLHNSVYLVTARHSRTAHRAVAPRYRQRCSVSGKVSSHRLHFHTKLVEAGPYVDRVVDNDRLGWRVESVEFVRQCIADTTGRHGYRDRATQ